MEENQPASSNFLMDVNFGRLRIDLPEDMQKILLKISFEISVGQYERCA